MNTTSLEKYNTFLELHQNGNILVLPNIWDVLGARLLQSLGYKAVATASASVALSNGYIDGEHIPFEKLISIVKSISSSIDIPLSVDFESGYSDNPVDLKKNVTQLISAGVAGINIEDHDLKNDQLFSIELQCNKIKDIKKAAREMGTDLFINARTDVLLSDSKHLTAKDKFNLAVERGKEYISAGANCFYPLGLKEKQDIEKMINSLQHPINILTLPGIPDLKTLQKMGVARVSLGPSFLKIAIKSMKDLAEKLIRLEGLDEITRNDITSDYVNGLIKNGK